MSTILQSVQLDNTRGVSLTNALLEIPLASGLFDFASVSATGQDLDILDSDGVTSLTHSLRLWGQDVGLKLIATWPGPTNDGAGHTYLSAGQIAVGNLGLANPPHTLWAAGLIGAAAPYYGELNCYDRLGNKLWTFKSPTHDYIMAVSVGDVNGDGVLEVAVSTQAGDHKGYVINNTATSTLFSWDAGGAYYVRVATIGKLRNDLPGLEVLFGNSNGDLALVDHLGTQLWTVNLPTAGQKTVQSGIIADASGGGQNAIYVTQSNTARKINNAGGVVWAYSHPFLPTSTLFQIAAGHITSTTTKQLVTSISPHNAASTIGTVICLDDTGALLWERIMPVGIPAIAVGDVNGDGYDEVLVALATATAGDIGTQGWGGIAILDRNGNEIAFTSASGTGLLRFLDWQGSGKPSIMFGGYGDLLLYHYDWINQAGQGATVKATIPSLTAGGSKTIYLAKSATPILPALGDYTFDFSGANGSVPAAWVNHGGTWTIQSGRLTSGDSAHTSAREAFELPTVASDSFELEFDAWKPAQSDGSDFDYFVGVRYRCASNWVTNSPDGYQVLIGAKGNVQLFRTASSTGNVQTVFNSTASGLTFSTTDQLRIRLVVAGNDHSAAYRKGSGPWTVLFKIQDTQPGTPVSAAGSIAFVNNRGQCQFAGVVMRTIPTAITANGPGPGPVVSLVPVVVTSPPFTPDATASYLVQESGGHLLYESGASGVLIEAPVAVSTTFYLVQESGGRLLLEDGASALRLETPGIVPVGPGQLRQAVYARLAGSPAITALVGARIHFGALPQTINLRDGPAVSYAVISRPYGHVLTGSDGTSQARVQITAHAYQQSAVDLITQAVRGCFDGYVGTIEGVPITACILDNELDMPSPPFAGTDQWSYSIASDYQINHRVSLPANLN